MKKTLKLYRLGLIFISISIIVLSITFATLQFFDVFKGDIANITHTVLTFLSFLIFGFLIGKKVENKGIIHGLILSVFYIAVFGLSSLIFGFDIAPHFVSIALKSICIIVGCILGVNYKK